MALQALVDSRRGRLAAAVASAGVGLSIAGCGVGGEEPAAGTMTIATVATDTCAQGFIAEEKGFFEEHDLEVKITVVAGIPELAAAVSSGQAQLACSSPVSVMTANAQGLDFSIVAGGEAYSEENGAAYIMVGKDEKGIKSVNDLAGETIAVNALSGSMVVLSTKAALDDAGVDLDSIEFVKVDFPAIGQAIESGQVPAGVLVSPFYDQALNAGIATRLVSPYASVNDGEPFPVTVWFGQAKYVDGHAGEIEGFRQAIADATRWANDTANVEERKTILAEHTGLESAVLERVQLTRYADTVEPDQLQSIMDVLLRFDELEQAIDLTQILAAGD